MPHPKPIVPFRRQRQFSLIGLMPRWRTCLVPVALAASILILPVASPVAEAAEARQVRFASSSEKHQAATRSRATLRKPVTQSRGTRVRDQRVQPSPRPAVAKASPEAVERALRHAAQATELNYGVLRRIADRESRLNPIAGNPASTARGLMQFTRDTWLEVVRDFGPRHGLSRQADALTTDRNGNIGARNWRELQDILRLRDDPHLSAMLAAERLKKARPALEGSIGRVASPADLYLVHLLGPTGARQFLAAVREAPGRSSVVVVGNVTKSNPGIFERRGQTLPVSKVYEEVAEMFEPGLTVSANVAVKGEAVVVAGVDR